MRDRLLASDGAAAKDGDMTSVIPSEQTHEPRFEAERQLAAAAERHREALASLEMPGLPQAGQHVAVKGLARSVHLVSFTLRRAAASGVPFERLVELTGWEPDLVREGLERLPEPRVVARLIPADVDPAPIAAAVTALEAVADLRELVQLLLADAVFAAEDPSLLGSAELRDLHDRVDASWRSWRRDSGIGDRS
ncbi:hypothetical protein DVA67_007060 [Solirubrobacter sp. CPCC 204708]|uniref:DUF222 domain-containing protein n=1 Tax=Solirubrobacter deserti TaxID=2282478 RepID=A0ABT4RP88_9ACTN|nr:hypothetical protein [Solirubrobacter deserti]MBE2315728.1 hypothetical protein [Solirubrobacter deserti]MDA0140382.1 hypothetical protein [Solirubrobacter deserti]